MSTHGPFNLADETVSERLARALAPYVGHAFGVVGNGNVHVVDALTYEGVTYTAVRHESASVSAADAFYRASGNLAMATTTYGAGFTNTLTAVAEAVRARTPMILVAGAGPEAGQRRWDVEQAALAAAVGARTFPIGRADVARTVIAAAEHARVARSVSILLVPYDLTTERALPEPAWKREPEVSKLVPVPDDDSLDEIVGLLQQAERPLILAGRGAVAAEAGPVITELARLTGSATATTVLARGLTRDHGGDLGVAGGFAAAVATETMASADLLLVLGASLDDFTTGRGQLLDAMKHVIQVDLAPAATHRRVDTYVHGDARSVTERLLAAMSGTKRHPWLFTDGLVTAPLLGDALADDGRLDPRAVTAWLDRTLPEDRVVVQDGGHFMQWPVTYLRTPDPSGLLMVGLAYQSIGLGLGGAVGAAAALPATTTVICVGDGGALMALSDLETVIRTIDHGVVLVYNDAAYGAEIHQYAVDGLDPTPMLVDEVDFGSVAHSLGARGFTVRTPRELAALAGVLSERPDGVVVVDLHISREYVAPFVGALSGH